MKTCKKARTQENLNLPTRLKEGEGQLRNHRDQCEIHRTLFQPARDEQGIARISTGRPKQVLKRCKTKKKTKQNKTRKEKKINKNWNSNVRLKAVFLQ